MSLQSPPILWANQSTNKFCLFKILGHIDFKKNLIDQQIINIDLIHPELQDTASFIILILCHLIKLYIAVKVIYN